MNRSLTQPTKPRPREAVHTSGGRMRACRSSGKPPRYMSPSRSRISLPSLAVKGMLWLFTEIKPAGKALALSQSEGFCCRRKRVGDTQGVSLRLTNAVLKFSLQRYCEQKQKLTFALKKLGGINDKHEFILAKRRRNAVLHLNSANKADICIEQTRQTFTSFIWAV